MRRSSEPAAWPESARKGGGVTRGAALSVAVVGIGLLALALWAAAEDAAQAAAPRRGTEFSAYIDDLPIMPGLAENDDGYVFDLFQGGRLAESRLAGDADVAVVRGFYAATLAQLGWRASANEPYVYRRGRERLIFLVEDIPTRRGAPRRGLEAVFVITPEDQTALAPAGPR